MLVLISMLYDEKLNISFEDLEQTIIYKANKWAELQNRELDIKYPLPYEIHVTVNAEGIIIDSFKDACRLLNVKPIVLDLEINNGSLIKDVMISSVFMGNNGEAIREVERISKGLKSFGFDVVREKVETVPWHPTAPSKKNNNLKMPENCYFECHFGILLNSQKEKEELKETLNSTIFDIHLSQNFFKKNQDGTYKIMATYRSYNDYYEQFEKNVKQIEELLKFDKYKLDKTLIEFSVYDTKVTHDSEWIGDKSK